MNKLEVVKFLIEEIENESKLLIVIEADRKQANEKSKNDNNNGKNYWGYLKYDGREYSRSRIKNNCKKIRQLMLDISKECE